MKEALKKEMQKIIVKEDEPDFAPTLSDSGNALVHSV